MRGKVPDQARRWRIEGQQAFLGQRREELIAKNGLPAFCHT